MRLKKYIGLSLAVGILLATSGQVFAQKAKTAEEEKYLEVLQNRSEKIMDDYEVLPADATNRHKVRSLMVKQYWDLNKVHDGMEALLKAKKKELSSEEYELLKAREEKKADKQLLRLQKKYLKNLARYLNQDQIDRIKDGMTLGALAHNYNGYLAMIPSLAQEEKEYIYHQFSEARDKAMVLGSSKDKLAVFRQYKGRINNWLSSERGYDLKKEGEAWQERIKASE